MLLRATAIKVIVKILIYFLQQKIQQITIKYGTEDELQLQLCVTLVVFKPILSHS